MIRKFNFTGRKRIGVKHLQINLIKERGKNYFDASIESLDNLDIKSESKLVLEAFDRGSYQRFDWGTVGRPAAPNPEDRQLTDIQEVEMVNFRLRAIDDNKSIGKILATTKNIRVWAEEVEDTRKASLLPVTLGKIDDAIWEINFEIEDDADPELILNDKFDKVDIKEMLRTDAFFTTLIYPSVLNMILTQIIMINNTRTDDGYGWESRWLKFTLRLPGVDQIPEDGNERKDREWIKNAVNMFCRMHSMIDILKPQVSKL